MDLQIAVQDVAAIMLRWYGLVSKKVGYVKIDLKRRYLRKMGEQKTKKTPRSIKWNVPHCGYMLTKYGYVTECGCRVAYKRKWRYCPYCGRCITTLWDAKK